MKTSPYTKIARSLFILLMVLSCAFVLTTDTANASNQQNSGGYTPLVIGGIPGFETAEDGTISPAAIMKNIYSISIGLGSILAVIMIIWAGMRYTVSEAVGSKEAAKHDIIAAVLGLVLLLGSYIILRTINVDLVNINLDLGGGAALEGGLDAPPPSDAYQYSFTYTRQDDSVVGPIYGSYQDTAQLAENDCNTVRATVANNLNAYSAKDVGPCTLNLQPTNNPGN